MWYIVLSICTYIVWGPIVESIKPVSALFKFIADNKDRKNLNEYICQIFSIQFILGFLVVCPLRFVVISFVELVVKYHFLYYFIRLSYHCPLNVIHQPCHTYVRVHQFGARQVGYVRTSFYGILNY